MIWYDDMYNKFQHNIAYNNLPLVRPLSEYDWDNTNGVAEQL